MADASTALVYANAYANLQTAINATPAGGTLYLPAGDYPLSGTGNQLLLISKAITIRGEGRASRLVVAASVPATTDVIRVNGSAEIVGLRLSDFLIDVQSGQPARYAINLDASGGGNPIYDATIARVATARFGSEGLAMFGPTPPMFDGVFTSAVTECDVKGGMLLQRAGDSLTITANKFSGGGKITINLIGSGSNTAHGLVFMFNNVTSDGGIQVLNSWQGAISYNNIELYDGATGSNGAIVDFDGNAAIPPEGFEIRGNYIGAGATGVSNSIRINRAKGLRIEGNTLPRGSGKTIVLTANADRTQILFNREQPYGELITSWLDDNGTNTVVAYVHPNTGRLTLPRSTDLGTLRVGPGGQISNSDHLLQYVGDLVTTANTSDVYVDSRIQVGSIGLAVPYNPVAASMTGVYVAAGAGELRLVHPPTAGGGFALFSTRNPPA